MDNEELKSFTLGLKITTVYLLAVGGISLIWPLLGLGPHHPEFEAQSTAYKSGTYLRNSLINITFLASGIGIILRKKWGRKTGLIVLVIGAVYTGNEFAWGYQNGPPSNTTLIISYLVTTTWNGIWFYFLFRKSTVSLLN